MRGLSASNQVCLSLTRPIYTPPSKLDSLWPRPHGTANEIRKKNNMYIQPTNLQCSYRKQLKSCRRAAGLPVLGGRPANRVPPTHLASQVHHSARALPDKSSSSEPIKAMLERLPSNSITCQSCDSPKHCLARNSSSPERSKATPTFTDKTGKGARVCRPPHIESTGTWLLGRQQITLRNRLVQKAETSKTRYRDIAIRCRPVLPTLNR